MNDQQRMIKEIEMEIRLTSGYTGINSFDDRVMSVMEQVPRHQFVPPELRSQAYDNGPLPIGSGQTISQPYIVALMTHLLNPESTDIILEVGTGSCYQAAILS
jgi:protein-L-isoaspartate(D-aspartate) O-methyltransferase